MRRSRTFIVIVFAFFMALTLQEKSCQAYDPSEVKFQKFDFQKKMEGKLIYGKEKNKITVQLNTNQKKKGYYTATAFQSNARNVSRYAGVSFQVENPGKHSLRMNMAINTVKDGVLSVKDNTSVMLDEEGVISFTKASNGCFDLPADFKGRVTIPFYTVGQTKINKIYGIGFIFVLKEKMENTVSISKMNFTDQQGIPERNQIAILQIEGKDSMLRPIQGSSTETYQAVAYDMLGKERKVNAKLSLDKHYDGISISSTGNVVVDDSVKDEEFNISAVTGSGATTTKKVYLQYSWTKKAMTKNGYNAAIAKPSEITPLLHAGNPLMNNMLMVVIRVLALFVAIVFLVHYIYKRRKYKRKFVEEGEHAILK